MMPTLVNFKETAWTEAAFFDADADVDTGAVWKIGKYFGSDRLSLSSTFLYGVTCLQCLPYCSHFVCNFLQPTSKEKVALKAAEVSLDKAC